jgi:hypothetical protein
MMYGGLTMSKGLQYQAAQGAVISKSVEDSMGGDQSLKQ